MTEWSPHLSLTKRFWVGCGVMLLGISFLVAAVLQSRDVRALARDGVFIEALVIDTREDAPSNDDDDWAFHLSYTFTANDKPFTNERRVPEQVFADHPIGTTWTIRVHPDDLSLHDLYPGETKRNTWGLLAASAFLTAIGAFFALSGGTLIAIRARP